MICFRVGSSWLGGRGMRGGVLDLLRQFPDLLPFFPNGLAQDDVGRRHVRREILRGRSLDGPLWPGSVASIRGGSRVGLLAADLIVKR